MSLIGKPNTDVERVAKWIRTKVPRPRELPESITGDLLRWKRCRKEWRRFSSGPVRCCPLGLIPGVSTPTPYFDDSMPRGFPFGEDELQDFARFWDKQRDPQAATDWLWPKRRRKRKQ